MIDAKLVAVIRLFGSPQAGKATAALERARVLMAKAGGLFAQVLRPSRGGSPAALAGRRRVCARGSAIALMWPPPIRGPPDGVMRADRPAEATMHIRRALEGVGELLRVADGA